MAKLEIKLKRSLIGKDKKQRKILKALGLNKVNKTVIQKDCPEIQGMINKVSNLLEVKKG